MEQVMKHYGNAILAVIVLLALGAIIVAHCRRTDMLQWNLRIHLPVFLTI